MREMSEGGYGAAPRVHPILNPRVVNWLCFLVPTIKRAGCSKPGIITIYLCV